MEPRTIAITAIILLANCLYAQSGWIRGIGAEGFDYGGRAITFDPEGNVYVTGGFSQVVDFGGVTLSSRGFSDVFTAKFDKTGKLLWVTQAGGSLSDPGPGAADHDKGRGVAVDGVGNVFVTGELWTPSAFFDTVEIKSPGFLAKYSPNGKIIWVKEIEGFCFGVTVDEKDNVYVIAGPSLQKYNSDGIVQWDKRLQRLNPNPDLYSGNAFYAVTTDKENGVYVTGSFIGTVNFGGVTKTAVDADYNSQIFLAKYDSESNLIWVKSAIGGHTSNEGRSISLDGHGGVYVTGTIRGDSVVLAFDSLLIQKSFTHEDIFIAKYTESGNVSWVKLISGSKDENGLGIYHNKNNSFFVVGTFNSDSLVVENSIYLRNNGSWDILVAKYASDGNLEWIKNAGWKEYDVAYSVSVDISGGLYFTGAYHDSLMFSELLVGNSGNQDIFLCKVGQQSRVYEELPLDIIRRGFHPLTDIVELEIKNDEFTLVEVKLADILGRTVLDPFKTNLQLSENKVTMNVSRLSPGSYFIILRSANGSHHTERLIVH